MKALLNINDEIVKNIILNRPYSSIKDFYYKVKPNKKAMVSLIKAGAFDEMMDRRLAMAWYLWETCDKKSQLNLQNMPTLIKYNLIPKDTPEKQFAYRIYEFNRYLKAKCKENNQKEFYVLNERAVNFLTNNNYDNLIQQEGKLLLSIKAWDKIYQKEMNVFREWLQESKKEVLASLNEIIFKEAWDKYAGKGNLSAWEMEVLCFYYHPHELQNVNMKKYGLVNFYNLSKNPIVEKTFYKNKKAINMFKLSYICGTCIAKNKNKGIVTLLTVDGVVNVKFRKEYFALFDKRISELGDDGKKHIVEKSWFDRGNMIMVQGIRSEDNFITKKYASSGGHQLHKIIEVLNNGDLVLQTERYKGETEE